MLQQIALKSGALLEHNRAYIWFTHFYSNKTEKSWVIINFQKIQMQSFVIKPPGRTTWKLICSYIKQWRSAFWWLGKNWPKNNRYINQTWPGKKIAINSRLLKNQEFPPLSDITKRNELKIAVIVDWGLLPTITELYSLKQIPTEMCNRDSLIEHLP